MYKISGTVLHISEVKQVTEKFKTRELIVYVDGMYPNEVKMQVNNERCDLLNDLEFKQQIEVEFFIQGKSSEKNGKKEWFNTLLIKEIKKL